MIYPTFQFSTNATPTREDFITQALSLQATGITNTALASSLNDLLISADTGSSQVDAAEIVTSALGRLWLDMEGNLWGKNRWGAVKVHRGQGGWETNRFTTVSEAPVTSGASLAGHFYALVPSASAPTAMTDSDIVIKKDDLFWTAWAVSAEAVHQTDGAHVRLVGRGWTPIFTQAYTAVSEPALMAQWSPSFWTPHDAGLFEIGFNPQQYGAEVYDTAGASVEKVHRGEVFPPIWRLT